MALEDAFDTQRLRMRSLRRTDQTLYVQLYTDPMVMRHIGMPMEEQAAWRAFDTALTAAAHHAKIWVIAEPATHMGIGILGLQPHQPREGEAEFGIMLLPSAQGSGYAVESIAGLADHVFAQTGRNGIDVLWSRQKPTNAAVVRLMQRLNFVRMASMPENSEIRWQMVREDWSAHCMETAEDAK